MYKESNSIFSFECFAIFFSSKLQELCRRDCIASTVLNYNTQPFMAPWAPREEKFLQMGRRAGFTVLFFC